MIYSDEFQLTAGDFDRFKKIKPYAIFNIFQEVAANHAELLHAGYDEFKIQNKAWILLRNKYELLKEPVQSQKVIVQTWPLPGQKIEYDREFLILDMDKNILIKGTSKWSIIDLTTKRLTRYNYEFNGDFFLNKNFAEELTKIPNIDINEDNYIYSYQVKYSDIDLYQHMNNAKYSDVLLNALDLKENEIIKEIQINFNNETKMNEIIKIYRKFINDSCYIVGLKESDLISFKAIVKTKYV